MKSSLRWRIIEVGGLSVLIIVLAVVIKLKIGQDRSQNDFRLAFVSSEGIQLRSISPRRRMINVLDVDGTVQIWIPGGLGWYESNKVGRLLAQEKRPELIKDVLFYNFGFDSDLVVFAKSDGSGFWWQMTKKWGWGESLSYLIDGQNSLMVKQERIVNQLPVEADLLATIMPRDFGDSRVVEDVTRVKVYNMGGVDGLAGFIARNIEWSGINVGGVENIAKEGLGEDCLLVFGKGADTSFAGGVLKNHFGQCKVKNNLLLEDGEIELYLSDKFATMVNYDSYNN